MMFAGNVLMLLSVSWFSIAVTFEDEPQGKSIAAALSEAHETLFNEFVREKRCAYSKDKALLSEVLISNETIRITKTADIKLPEGTHQVAALFDQIVMRGESLKNVKVTLISQDQSTLLKLLKSTDRNSLVFKLDQFPRFKPKKEKADAKNSEPVSETASPVLTLKIECRDQIVIKEISLRTTNALQVEFDAYKKSLPHFPDGMFGLLKERFYWSTKNRSFEELSNSLSERSQAFDRFVYTRTMGSSANQSHPIRGIVNDRRVAKLYEGLSQMDSSIAEEVAAANFDRTLEAYADAWSKAGILPNHSIYGVEAHLFLCSEFCSAEIVLDKIDKWEKWHAETSAKKGDFQFKYTARLDSVYAMNLQMNVIRRDRGLSIDELNSLVAAKLGPSLRAPPSLTDPSHGLGGNNPPTLKMISMLASDWTPARLDTIAEVPHIVFQSALHNPIRQTALRKILRDELLGESKK